MTLTPETIAELRALNEKATPIGWCSFAHDTGSVVRVVYRDEYDRRTTAYPVVCSAAAQPNDSNAALIAAMRNHLPALLDTAERVAELEAENAELRAALKPFASLPPFYEVAVEDEDIVVYSNGGGAFTVGDVRRARAAQPQF